MKDFKAFLVGVGIIAFCIFIGVNVLHFKWYQVFYSMFADTYYYVSDSTWRNIVTTGGLNIIRYILQVLVVLGVAGVLMGFLGDMESNADSKADAIVTEQTEDDFASETNVDADGST